MLDELNHELYSVYPHDEPFTATHSPFDADPSIYDHHIPDHLPVFGSDIVTQPQIPSAPQEPGPLAYPAEPMSHPEFQHPVEPASHPEPIFSGYYTGGHASHYNSDNTDHDPETQVVGDNYHDCFPEKDMIGRPTHETNSIRFGSGTDSSEIKHVDALGYGYKSTAEYIQGANKQTQAKDGTWYDSN